MNTLIRSAASSLALVGAALTSLGGAARGAEISDALRGLAPARVSEGDACTTRIIGGTCTTQKEWPWQVGLFMREGDQGVGFICGGSLIAPNWVLTAAHCFMSPGLSNKAEDWTVVNDVKKMTFNKLPDDAKAVAVKRVIVNQDYNPKNFTNDVALMELAEPLAATPIKAQFTADPQLEENRDITVTGWGRTRWIQRKTDSAGHPVNDEQGHAVWVDGETGERVDPMKVLSPDLQKVSVPLVDIAECAHDFEGGNGVVDQRNLCAGPPEGGHDTCQGDSGGPVMAEDASHEWRQVGIVSWGPIRCAMAGHPSVFTRVSAFADWIQHNVGSSSQEPTPAPCAAANQASVVGERRSQ